MDSPIPKDSHPHFSNLQVSLSSERSSDALLRTIHHHLALHEIAPSQGIFSHIQISADLLFSISSCLAVESCSSVEEILPYVLCRLRKWRVLPRDERLSSAVLRAMALDLAGLSEPLDPPPSRKMQNVWSGTLDRNYNLSATSTSPTTQRIRSPSAPVPSHHETASFRSGFSACRMPRDTITQRHHHPSCAQQSSDAENVPPPAAQPLHEIPSSRNNMKHSIPRIRTGTVVSVPTANVIFPRRNPTSTTYLPSSLSKSAIIVPRAVPTAVISRPYSSYKPHPWPLPPHHVATQSKLSEDAESRPVISSGRPRVVLGPMDSQT
ncbi:hypothetical protein C8R44DRAFT_893819 [Mycena epipterygia]|nr:hypothetical protein C8R44DRAFT_893819 [Mycena epipterygia]